MKFASLAFAVTLIFSAVLLAQTQGGSTYAGEIIDSDCAATGDSHAGMIKGNPNVTEKDCTIACVSHGAKFVLLDPNTKTIYQLDDQKQVEPFAGAKATVTGVLDNATKTIRVLSIKAS